MSIELGLSRIQSLLLRTPQTWKAVHVAGTNGKGSICAYVTAMLQANNVRSGRFTSPHLIDRWDCISINGAAVSEKQYRHFEGVVKRRDEELRLGATHFELLTATAFEIFEAENVEVGVVEVGLGGRLDSTNALKEKLVTVIAKIGLDHQSFLGDTLEAIAFEKAGIMRQGVPCIADSSNQKSVLDIFKKHSQDIGAPLSFASPEENELARELRNELEPHQLQNLACAFSAFKQGFPQLSKDIPTLAQAVRKINWPGRLQLLDISALVAREEQVLLDGAHNPQSAEVLAAYVEKHLRKEGKPVTWVLAASQGKDLLEILKLLVNPGDAVSAVEFGPVANMPWVQPMKTNDILQTTTQCGLSSSSQHDAGSDVSSALDWAARTADGGPLVIAGSLYLVSDIMRLLRSKGV